MIGVLGAGAFGTALAISFAHSGDTVVLWGRNAQAMARARQDRTLPRLPGAHLPKNMSLTSDGADLAACAILVLAVPTQGLAATLGALPAMAPRAAVAACKGIDLTHLTGPTATIAKAWPSTLPAILSGPSFAADIARGLPTALSLGCADASGGTHLQHTLSTPNLRLYRTADVAGVELGGALKNIVAIACGAAIGAGLGESARAALMTRGMAEMMRLASALGAKPETLMGLSGLGDLALTCASPQSRNFALGQALGAGTPRPDATTEGVATAKAALKLATRHRVEMPVTRATEALVDGRLSIKDAVTDLLTRDLRTE
ncbi:MAG: NAD(P)H-dependent glycerol-3-phosphate dehydrogenase [Pseudomonadota bacterium]